MDTEEWIDTFGKAWSEMTKDEKRRCYDEMLVACKEAGEALENDLNSWLKNHTSMTVRVEIKLTPDPNDDPRLP